MPIVYNTSACLAHGYTNVSQCWVNYTITSPNALIPDPLHIVTINLPWFGMAIYVAMYVVLFILFYKSGGREKFLGMSFIGLFGTIIFLSINLFQTPAAGLAALAFSVFLVVISIVAYALIKDSGE